MKSLNLKLKVCTLITSWFVFYFKSILVVYSGKMSKYFWTELFASPEWLTQDAKMILLHISRQELFFYIYIFYLLYSFLPGKTQTSCSHNRRFRSLLLKAQSLYPPTEAGREGGMWWGKITKSHFITFPHGWCSMFRSTVIHHCRVLCCEQLYQWGVAVYSSICWFIGLTMSKLFM